MEDHKPQKPEHIIVTISSLTFLKVIILVIVLGFLWVVRDILLLVLVAIILAAAFDPWVDWFQRRGIPRAFSILGIYLVLLGVIALAVGMMIPVVIEQMGELARSLPHAFNKVSGLFADIRSFSVEYGFIDQINNTLSNWQSSLGKISGDIFSVIGGVFGGVVALFSVLVMTFYMIIEEDNTKKFIRSISPAQYQDYFIDLMDRISIRMGQWLRGQLILSGAVGILVYIGLKILGIEYAFILALLSAITEVIPYIGPLLGALPGVLLGFTVSPLTGVFTIIVYFVVQQLENQLLTPKVMSKAVGLNPVVVIIVLLMGAKIGGAIGAIIAIPVAIIVSIFLKDFLDDPARYNRSSSTTSDN